MITSPYQLLIRRASRDFSFVERFQILPQKYVICLGASCSTLKNLSALGETSKQKNIDSLIRLLKFCNLFLPPSQAILGTLNDSKPQKIKQAIREKCSVQDLQRSIQSFVRVFLKKKKLCRKSSHVESCLLNFQVTLFLSHQ